MQFLALLQALTAFAVLPISAHPGHDHKAEALARKASLEQFSKRDLSHCASSLKERGVAQRQIARREELARSLSLAAALEKRALSDINQSHYSSANYTLDTAPEVLFSTNNSCTLSPETILGPYYVAGEFVRKDISEDIFGVPLFFDAQVVDIDTCEPVDDVFVEIWSCNSTGVYSGVVADGNGNINDTANLNETWLRGIQHTDAEGIVSFKTVFPGHYSGRTTHIHVVTHINATVLHNGTIMNNAATHVGQVFFDQDLIHEIEALEPYTQNTQALTLNSNDSIITTSANGSDPMMHYVRLGEEVQDGVLAWIEFGINRTANSELSPASWYYQDGGVTNPNQTLGDMP